MMRWYWYRAGGHTHVRVFMYGGKCGDLCFRNEEWDGLFGREVKGVKSVQQKGIHSIELIHEGDKDT